MSDLTVRDLGALFDGPHATPKRIESGPYFLNIASLNGGRLELDQSDHVSEMDFQKWTKRVEPTEGDLLFSYETRLGEAALMPADVRACLGRRMALIRPNRSVVNPKFLLYYYLSPGFQRTIEQHTIHGATVNRISLSTMGAWPVSIPSLDEQRAIAEVLGALDDKIAANTKLAAIADELLATRFESIVDAETPLIRLSEIADVNRLTLKPSPGGQLRYVDIASVGVGSYAFPPATPWDGAPSRARRAIRKGDTLWSTVRPNRRSHALNLSDDRLLVGSTGLAVLTARTVGWAYLYEVTRRREFTSYLETVAEGSAYPAVRADKFGEALVPLADESSQRSFDQLAEPLREQLHVLDEENRTLAATRDALLPQLMSGKLRVRNAEKVLENAGV